MSTIYWIHRSYLHILKLCFIEIFILGFLESIEFCQDSFSTLNYTQIGSSIYNITSPGYPATTYKTNSNCFIEIQITFPQEGVLTIEHYGIVPVNCTSDYTIADGNLSALPNYSRCFQSGDGGPSQLINVLARKNVDHASRVFIHLLPVSEERKGFRIITKILPLLPMRPKVNHSACIESLTETPSGYIKSHETFPTSYRTNLKTYLELTDIPESTKGIVIEFIYFNIGDRPTCSLNKDKDRLFIFTLNNTVKDVWYLCSDTDSPKSPITLNFTDKSPITSLLFEFQANNTNTRGGFLLKFSLMASSVPLPGAESVPRINCTISPPTLSTTTSASTPSTSTSTLSASASEFFEVRINVIAVAAGGGGLILTIIIIVLCCVIYRRNRSRKSKEALSPDGEEIPEIDSRFIQISLTPATRPSEVGRREINVGNEYSSVDLELSDPYSSVDMDSSNPHTFVLRKNSNGNATANPKTPPQRLEPEGVEASGGEIYTQINPKTKKERVEMIDNELYASRDSLD